MKIRNQLRWLCSIAFSLLAAPALASTPTGRPQTAAYALVVGSQRAGAGQQPLRYAIADAQRVGSVLTEIGGYAPERVHLLEDPDADEIRAALEAVELKLASHAERDEASAFVFYYSGHARASALSLGTDELPVEELRAHLEGLSATVSVVILDACQSGAISRIKGVEPASSFSYNSVASLNTSGLAVLASSTGSELSQESETIGGSFFTHHLVSGLRGAADDDDDGRVTLSEAYRYAHSRTLISTSSTAVGRQHVTLETELRGRGEMVLTYPAEASAHLELPPELSAEVLVHREPSRTVVAEIYKSKGDRMRLALPPGAYGALVRRGEKVVRCQLAMRANEAAALELSSCRSVEVAAVAKHGVRPTWSPTWSLELAVGAFDARDDKYTERLEDFGYEPGGFWGGGGPQALVSVFYHLDTRFALGITYSTLDNGNFERDAFSSDEEARMTHFDWTAHRLGLTLRAGLPLFDGILTPYGQAGVGLTMARTELDGEQEDLDETQWGYHLAVGGGLQYMPWRHVGVFGQAEYVYAPTLENLLGDQHDSGGAAIQLGLRGAL